ncbi:MAG: hypothetical protein Q9166_008043 [cf. Caloplaca sp. 2 TL-2023]
MIPKSNAGRILRELEAQLIPTLGPQPAPPPPPPHPDNKKSQTVELSLPINYPPLESHLDVHVPLHFTWTDLKINGQDDPIYEVLHQLDRAIRKQLSAYEIATHLYTRYGRIEDHPDDSVHSSHTSGESWECRHPRVFAIVGEPKDMHRHWRTADKIVKTAIREVMGDRGTCPVPVRYYYRWPDMAMVGDD